MKYLSLVIFSLLGMIYSSALQAQELLSQEEKEEAKAWAQKFQKDRHENRNVDFGKIKSLLLNACSSEKAAFDLYLEAIKTSMIDITYSILDDYAIIGNNESTLWLNIRRNSLKSKITTSQFTKWQKENKDKNNNPEFRKALQIHLKWLLIRLRKHEAIKQDQELDIRSDAMMVLNEYISQIEKLAIAMGQAQSEIYTIQAYLKVSTWDLFNNKIPGSILDLETIFEEVFCSPLKESNDVEGLRKMWEKNIVMNTAVLKALSKNKDGNSEQNKLEITDYVLDMQIKMECECYQLGDEVRAVDNLKKIIISIRKPKSKKEAIEKMEVLLNGKK